MSELDHSGTEPRTRKSGLRRRSAIELASRSVAGAAVHPVLALLLVLSTRVGHDYPLPSSLAVLVLLLIGAARFFLKRGFEVRYDRIGEQALLPLLGAMALQNFLAGCLGCVVMLHYGPSEETFFALLFGGAAGAGGTSSLALRRSAHWVFLACLLGPLFVGATLAWGPDEGFFLMALLVFIAFLVRDGALARQNFEKLVLTQDDLAAANEELEDRVAQRTFELTRAHDALLSTERRLRRLLENAADTVLVCDENLTATYVTPNADPVLGYSPSERLGRNVIEQIHPDDVAKARKVLKELFEHPGELCQTDVRARHKDGSWRALEVSARNLLDDPAIHGIVVCHRDVTERERAAEERRLLEDRLRQGQKMEAIGQLAGGIAHDFNNSLTVVRGTSELLLEENNLDAPVKEQLGQIVLAADRAANLTRQLLAFARRQVLEPEVVNLNEEVQRTASMLHRLIGEDIEMHTVLQPALWCVKVDPSQIEQVILNLASNARSAMPKGGTLTLETSNVELDAESARAVAPDLEPGSFVMLRVCDTGVGISDEDQSHIFEPFYTTRTRGAGTGLGLATAHGIIQQSGGAIVVESAPGEGSCFHVYLPRSTESPPNLDPRSPEEPSEGTERILLVEDETSVRSVMRHQLERAGYEVIDCGDPEEALALCDEDTRLLLTDVVMPKLSGRELADRLTARFPDLKVLLVSGYAEELVGDGTAARSFLAKPFSARVLAQKVREALDGEDGPATQPAPS